jgi:hypothetical protein
VVLCGVCRAKPKLLGNLGTSGWKSGTGHGLPDQIQNLLLAFSQFDCHDQILEVIAHTVLFIYTAYILHHLQILSKYYLYKKTAPASGAVENDKKNVNASFS